jgi:hypothetical protein
MERRPNIYDWWSPGRGCPDYPQPTYDGKGEFRRRFLFSPELFNSARYKELFVFRVINLLYWHQECGPG